MKNNALLLLAIGVLAVPACMNAMPAPDDIVSEPGADEDGAVTVFDNVALDEDGAAAISEAPFPFVRLGVRFTSTNPDAFELRTRPDGGAWSAWTRPTLVFSEETAHAGHLDIAADSEPARGFQYRAVGGDAAPTFVALEPMAEVGVVPEDALSTDAEIDTAANEAEQGLNLGMVSRAAWGARAPLCKSLTGVRRATVHHTASANDDSTPAAVQMRQLQAFHMFSRGWCDIGYNFLVSRDGRVFEGRGYGVTGAHADNANADNMGISFIGTYQSVAPPLAQQIAAAKVLRYLKDRAGIPLTRDGANGVKGHRQRGTTSTSCPGDRLYALLGSIVDRARNGDFATAAPPPSSACATGQFAGAFCDDEGHVNRTLHDRLKQQLDVNFHCANVAGSPAYCPSAEARRQDGIFVFGKAANMPTAGFSDAFVDDTGKREAYFNAAAALGILGTGNGNANPDHKLTRSSAAVILMRMYDLPPATQDYFDDDQAMANENAHNRAAEAGLIGGYADSNGGRKDFRPGVSVTRSDLAVLATRVADSGLVPVWRNPEPCRSGLFAGTFCDDDGQQLEAFNEALIATGVEAPWRRVNGHPLFEAEHHVTRGAVVYMFTQAAAIPLDGHPDAFVDDATHDRARWFDAARAYGIIGGYAGGTEMRPYDPANRDTLAIVLTRIYGLADTDEDFFSDDDGTAVEPYHNKVAAAGLFAGFDDGNGGRRFSGALQANRADVSVLQARAVAAGLRPIWAP